MASRSRKSGGRRSSGLAGTVLALFFVLLLGAAFLGWLIYVPFGPETETFVEVAPGTPAVRIARELESAGVVRSRYAFDLVRSYKGGTLRAGEYRFDHPATVFEVYSRLQRGDVYTKTLVVPEGASIFDVASRLEQAGFGTQKEFLDGAAKDTQLVADLDPGAKTLEGYLFPDTYRFSRKTTPQQIAVAMVHRFREAADQLGLKGNVHRVVTLASLVERETALDTESASDGGASVFENRLDKKMPLMTDPSVIYGLQVQHLWRGSIYASDLKRDTPYNTYLHAGLPPGPVANPGMRSLRAAMEPAQTDYLYFVAAGDNPQGRSMFASTLEEHDRNVAEYRSALKKAGTH